MDIPLSEYLDLELKNLSSEIKEELYGRNEMPSILYHYTNTNGLLGILSTDSIWCSDASFLNDISELKYAAQIIRSVADLFIDDNKDPDFANIIEGAFKYNTGLSDAYVLCFSEERDLLSQWRAYGAGGSGYAIGFNSHVLSSLKPISFIRKIEYNPEKQGQIIGHVIGKIYGTYKKITELTGGKIENNDLQKIVQLLSYIFTDMIIWFKHPAFSEEREWRVVCVTLVGDENYKNLEFRVSSGNLIPYFKLEYFPDNNQEKWKLPIVEIIHGPTLQTNLTQKSLYLLTQKNDYSKVKIEGSYVPLR